MGHTIKVEQASTSDMFIKIPAKTLIGIIGAILAYVFMGIWWAGQTSTTLRSAVVAVEKLNVKVEEQMSDRYRGQDARRDFSQVHQEIDGLAASIGELRERVRAIETHSER